MEFGALKLAVCALLVLSVIDPSSGEPIEADIVEIARVACLKKDSAAGNQHVKDEVEDGVAKNRVKKSDGDTAIAAGQKLLKECCDFAEGNFPNTCDKTKVDAIAKEASAGKGKDPPKDGIDDANKGSKTAESSQEGLTASLGFCVTLLMSCVVATVAKSA